jgi:hypothetical protein
MYSVILPLAAITIPLGLFFFFLGFLYSRHHSKYNLNYLIIFIAPFFIIINVLLGSYVDVHFNRLIYGNYFSFASLSILAIIITIYFSKHFHLNFLTWTGQKSMYFLVLHWPIFALIKNIFYIIKAKPVGDIFALVLIVAGFPACMIFVKIFGPNKLLFGK